MDSQREEATEGVPTPTPVDSGAERNHMLAGIRITLSVTLTAEAEGNLHSEEDLRKMDITSSPIRVETTEAEAEAEAMPDSMSNCKVLPT